MNLTFPRISGLTTRIPAHLRLKADLRLAAKLLGYLQLADTFLSPFLQERQLQIHLAETFAHLDFGRAFWPK
jgi:hypothetical protein